MAYDVRFFFFCEKNAHESIGGEIQMPSAKILAQKEEQLQELVSKIQNSAAGVLVNYQGITVEQDTALRTALRKAGVDYKVYKNSMTTRACDATGLGAMKEQLKGMTALAISKEDPIAAAKVMKEYSDKIETFSILGGYVDGEYVDAKGVEALAAIPSKEGLVAKILASLQSPLYGLAYVLQAKIDKENGDSAPEAAAE
jgi:large subunit ribosomal protein L10